MSTIAQGNTAEAAVLYALEEAGIPALLPFGGGLPFDLGAVDPDGRVLRVQVKCGRVRKGSVALNTASTDHGRGRLDYRGRADLIAVYVAELKRVFVVSVEECPRFVGSLRLIEARDNQKRGIRLAESYSFERWASSLVQAATSDVA